MFSEGILTERIKILDTTLRDGGYVNDWKFGFDNIQRFISGLISTGVDFVECGFLADKFVYNSDRTLYSSLSDFNNMYNFDNFTFMINFGDVDFNSFEFNDNCPELRIAFKPYQLSKVYSYVEPLVKNNIRFSLNPMHISLYSDEELGFLSDLTNKANPQCLTGVDTMGIMNNFDVVRVFEFLDKNINKRVPFGFHSHNNLGISFENVCAFINLLQERQLIIDATTGGLARGGGMIKTEDLAEFLNEQYNYSFDFDILKNISQNLILPIKLNFQQDKNDIYFLTAKYKCHPNYGKYLFDRNFRTDLIDRILNKIPDKYKPYYDLNVIKKIVGEI